MSRWYQHRKDCQCPDCRWHRQNQKPYHRHSSSKYHPVNKKQWEQIKNSLNDKPPEKYERLPPPPAGKIFTTCFWLVALAIVITVIYYASNGIGYLSSHKDDIISSVSSAANNALGTANWFKDDAVDKIIGITSYNPTPKTNIAPAPTSAAPVLVATPKPSSISIPSTTTTPSITTIENIEHEAFDMINKERVKAGLQPTSWDASLYKLSKAHTEAMANEGEMFHSPMGSAIGENAWGASWGGINRNSLAITMVNGWMSSPLHKAWILHAPIKESVISIVDDKRGQFSSWSFWISKLSSGPELVERIASEWRNSGSNLDWIPWLQSKGYLK